jgi:pimeloyl-ACP methyl ester carboxylesterase
VAQLAQARGLTGLTAVGFSQGAPFALACAAAAVVAGVAVVSGTDELASPELADALEPEVGLMVNALANDPVAMEASFHGFGDPDVMCEMVIDLSTGADREVYTDRAFQEAYRRALAEGFGQGPAGYARDTALSMSRWPFDPADISVPVDLWYGAHDTNPTHSPDLGATLSRRIPTARRNLAPDAGGALLWTHAEDILRTLLDRTAG